MGDPESIPYFASEVCCINVMYVDVLCYPKVLYRLSEGFWQQSSIQNIKKKTSQKSKDDMN